MRLDWEFERGRLQHDPFRDAAHLRAEAGAVRWRDVLDYRVAEQGVKVVVGIGNAPAIVQLDPAASVAPARFRLPIVADVEDRQIAAINDARNSFPKMHGSAKIAHSSFCNIRRQAKDAPRAGAAEL